MNEKESLTIIIVRLKLVIHSLRWHYPDQVKGLTHYAYSQPVKAPLYIQFTLIL